MASKIRYLRSDAYNNKKINYRTGGYFDWLWPLKQSTDGMNGHKVIQWLSMSDKKNGGR